MTENSEPIVRLGTQDTEGNVNAQFEVDYATDTGDALLRHISSGAEVRWNPTESRWELNQPTAVEEFLVDRLNSLEQNFIQLQSSLGDETQPVPGTSHFEAVNTEEAHVKKSSVESLTFPGDTSEILPFDHGIIILSKVSGGSETGVYILNSADNSVEKVAGSSTFVASTPSSGQVGVYHDGSNYIAEDNDSNTFEVTVSYLGR